MLSPSSTFNSADNYDSALMKAGQKSSKNSRMKAVIFRVVYESTKSSEIFISPRVDHSGAAPEVFMNLCPIFEMMEIAMISATPFISSHS